MTLLAFAAVMIVVWAYVIAATISTLRFTRRPIVAATSDEPVSVLKPLHGAEPGLYENLRSFTQQNHPAFQLVFGVRDRDDGALVPVRALIADKPECDIALVIDPRATGSNLKVANLENMLAAARHDLFVLADSDMRVEPDYLDVVTAPLADPATGMVTCLYKGVPGEGLWSRLAASHINFGFLPSAVLGEAMHVGGGCFGATMALRREVFERIGGFARVRNELADDHRMGSAVRRLGLRVALSSYVVANHVTEPSLISLWRHELRWGRTSRAMAPGGYAGSIVTHTVMVPAIAAALYGPSFFTCGAVLLSLLLRWGSATIIARRLAVPAAGLGLLLLRDVLSFAVFVGSFCGRSVLWRDQVFRVEASGRMRLEGDEPV
ncbi:MAG TPA: bacteriohopanetetrol glucosamine biosynthesis glycosyltransferase HpnI [Stellaceae bacterium]|jgi:ceramide glucosyltransferase|nr:bacteriohopanetetrol glucosamine biosynthesis glycosyltransferase HpnI [Stellaceae bacterium]